MRYRRGCPSYPLLSVVIPTYNESEIIARTLDEVSNVLEKEGISYEILVVDDDSPDGTWKVVERYSKVNPKIRLLRRVGKRGLASAILDGIKASRGCYVVVMDADLQHPPRYIPLLVKKALADDLDIVVASRYMKGGGVKGWSKFRLLMSRGATILARLLVGGAGKTSDPMSGFFLVKRSVVLEKINEFSPRGFKLLLEILARIEDAKVADVPYVFEPRKAGRSKLGMKTILDYIIHIIKLSKLIKFMLVGASGTVVNLLVMYALLYILRLSKSISSIAGIEAGLLWNFVFNEIWTFGAEFRDLWWERLAAYHASSAGGFIVTFLSMEMLSTYAGMNPLLAQFIGILLGFTVNYLASSRGVWRLGFRGRRA
jgi:dolichol-phosphate mannosyltransferase